MRRTRKPTDLAQTPRGLKITGPETRQVIMDDEYYRLLSREVVAEVIASIVMSTDESLPTKEKTCILADEIIAYVEEVLYDRH